MLLYIRRAYYVGVLHRCGDSRERESGVRLDRAHAESSSVGRSALYAPPVFSMSWFVCKLRSFMSSTFGNCSVSPRWLATHVLYLLRASRVNINNGLWSFNMQQVYLYLGTGIITYGHWECWMLERLNWHWGNGAEVGGPLIVSNLERPHSAMGNSADVGKAPPVHWGILLKLERPHSDDTKEYLVLWKLERSHLPVRNSAKFGATPVVVGEESGTWRDRSWPWGNSVTV